MSLAPRRFGRLRACRGRFAGQHVASVVRRGHVFPRRRPFLQHLHCVLCRNRLAQPRIFRYRCLYQIKQPIISSSFLHQACITGPSPHRLSWDKTGQTSRFPTRTPHGLIFSSISPLAFRIKSANPFPAALRARSSYWIA